MTDISIVLCSMDLGLCYKLPEVDSHSVFINFQLFLSFYFGYLTNMILKNELYSSELSSDMKQQICDCFVSIHHFY